MVPRFQHLALAVRYCREQKAAPFLCNMERDDIARRLRRHVFALKNKKMCRVFVKKNNNNNEEAETSPIRFRQPVPGCNVRAPWAPPRFQQAEPGDTVLFAPETTKGEKEETLETPRIGEASHPGNARKDPRTPRAAGGAQTSEAGTRTAEVGRRQQTPGNLTR